MSILHIYAQKEDEEFMVQKQGTSMVLKSKGKIYLPKRTMRGGARIYIPSEIVLDSTFPFKEDTEIIVEIDPNHNLLKLKPINSK